MDVYIYQADIYCGKCGAGICKELEAPKPDSIDDEDTWDSDDYPKGPYSDGGGESDTPNHCANCGIFLENPLSDYGRDYVRKAMRELKHGHGSREIVTQWKEFYGINYR